jgi:SnoaL-like domain
VGDVGGERRDRPPRLRALCGRRSRGRLCPVRFDAELADTGGLGFADTAAGTRHGPEGFLRATEEVLEAFADYRVETKDFIEAGDAVVVPVRISGRGRTSGAKLETRLAHLWVLRNGKVIRGEVYRTVDEALETVGLRE